ncbi:MAG: ASKHA domain-containing protein [Candidatus Promineifilaceae bacterium]|nr:ASKHA domain-containing protein [Candidatus Promineifilaceae bacterium]
MAKLTVIYGEEVKQIEVEPGTLLGEAIARTELPLEQPCAGRGTCGKCKVLVEEGMVPPDAVEYENLTEGELAVGNRLACRARVQGDAEVTLAPVVVYSNKIFRASNRYKRQRDVPLGLAIDLGSTTVAAFLTMLDNGEVCVGGAGLNQQTVYGADVISRLAAATDDPEDAERLYKLALASINQAVDSLNLSPRIRQRVQRVTVVGNVAMHHLLFRLPLDTLAGLPFQPYRREALRDASALLSGIFPPGVQISAPPLVGGFVGSDALACLAFFGFADPPGPMAAIDLGTNGEVMVTDGQRIGTASTAAGPAFEGVNISCGTRAVDGAVVAAALDNGELHLETIAAEPAVGLTGSGLLSLVYELRQAGLIEPSGRIAPDPPLWAERLDHDIHGARRIPLLADQVDAETPLWLTQWDVRELQKAKGAIRAAVEILLKKLDLQPGDLERVILTGSFGGQIDIKAVLGLGMIPPVRPEAVETQANGAGLGAALFLSDEGFALGERLAERAEQIDLDLDPDFNMRFVESMSLTPDGSF